MFRIVSYEILIVWRFVGFGYGLFALSYLFHRRWRGESDDVDDL